MLKILSGFCWLVVGLLFVAFLQLVLGFACLVDAGLKALGRLLD